MEGKSLAPLWQGSGKDYDTDIAVSEMWRRNRHIVALRTERHKYIWDSKEPDKEQLFDLIADPGETQNIVQDAPVVVESFRSRLQQQVRRATSGAEASAGAEPQHDARVIQRLHDLGYLD
jgi:hypothetical protein